MSFNFKRLTWLSCKNMALMTAAIFLTSAAIIGTVYVLAVMFGPAGMTIVLPLSVLAVISVVLAYQQIKTEERKIYNHDIRKKLAEKQLANEIKRANDHSTNSKTASK